MGIVEELKSYADNVEQIDNIINDLNSTYNNNSNIRINPNLSDINGGNYGKKYTGENIKINKKEMISFLKKQKENNLNDIERLTNDIQKYYSKM